MSPADQAAATLLEKGVLGALVIILMGAVTWLTLKLLSVLKDRDALHERCASEKKAIQDEKDKLHEAHKEELRANGRAYAELTKQTYAAIAQLHELAERLRP